MSRTAIVIGSEPAPRRVLLALLALLTGFALTALVPASARGAFAVALSNDSLVSFDTATPEATAAPTAVIGLTPGDSLVGIDFRPQNGNLYGLGFAIGPVGPGLALAGLTVGDGPPPAARPPSPPPSPASPGAAPPSFGAKTLVTLKLAKGRIGPGGPVVVEIANANAFPVGVGLSVRPALRPKTTILTVPAAAKRRAKLKLTKALRGRLKRKGKLTLRFTATVRDPAGSTRTVVERLSPRLKPKKRRKP